MKKKKKPLENSHFADAVGQSSLLQIDWMDWKKEQPKSGEDVWVIVKLDMGYYPVRGTYFDEIIPASGPFKEHRYREVRFLETMLPTIFIGTTDDKRLIAWGRNRTVIPLDKICIVCKRLDCVC